MSAPASSITPSDDQSLGALSLKYQQVRQRSLDLCTPLTIEDYLLQPIEDVSPVKWHLAHTSWFFETFLLKPHLPGYLCYQDSYEHLFNSYYNQVGQPWPRARRGDLSRPTVQEVLGYRAHIDEQMQHLLAQDQPGLNSLIALGLHHEQQHQELILTDIKYSFSINPLAPVYQKADVSPSVRNPSEWVHFEGGLVEIGTDQFGEDDFDHFAFDNESGQHQVYLQPYALASRLVTNGEFRAFIEDGGYQKPELWLSGGWAVVQDQNWQRPLNWRKQNTAENSLQEYHLTGCAPLDPEAPVCHLSLYEADAYARWRGARLPTEAEWEHAVKTAGISPAPQKEDRVLRPLTCQLHTGLQQMFGELWQWTASSYAPYPNFKPFAGNIGEYNGKFMCAQNVLRGSSFATSKGHARVTYRNFFYPRDRWQFTGLRLATDELGAP